MFTVTTTVYSAPWFFVWREGCFEEDWSSYRFIDFLRCFGELRRLDHFGGRKRECVGSWRSVMVVGFFACGSWKSFAWLIGYRDVLSWSTATDGSNWTQTRGQGFVASVNRNKMRRFNRLGVKRHWNEDEGSFFVALNGSNTNEPKDSFLF